MSAPLANEDRTDDPLIYAPRRARCSPPLAPEPMAPRSAQTQSSSVGGSVTGQPEAEFADSPPMAPGIGGPNIDLPLPRLRPFAGDVAVRDLRHRLALHPELTPEPPRPAQRPAALAWLWRFVLILSAAAVVTFGATMLMLSKEPLQSSLATAPTAAAPFEDTPQAISSAEPPRLIVESRRAFANEPLPLGISLSDSIGGETITLVGLATGTRLTAGLPLGLTGWQISAPDIAKAYAYAPKDFVGVMDTAIDLRSARDRLMDSQIVRLEWLPKQEARLPPAPVKLAPAAPVLVPEEIAMLLKRGEEFLRTGDIAAARLLLRRAANAGNAQAAFDLGGTFDEPYLTQQGVLGFAPDLAQARAWYEKAVELGSSEASHRLEQLASGGK